MASQPDPGIQTSTTTPGTADPGQPLNTPPAPSLGPAAKLTSGAWMTVGAVSGVLLSSTKVAPLAAGILFIAIIFQLNALHKGV